MINHLLINIDRSMGPYSDTASITVNRIAVF